MSLLLSLALAAAQPAKPDDLAVTAIHNFGACVVRTTPAGAEEVLAMDFRTKVYRDRLGRLGKGHSRCTRPGTELRSNGVLFAGGMAEALLEQRYPDLSAADQLTTTLAARNSLEALALCTVVTSPAGVWTLLKTEVTSPEEARAAEALEPTLNACLSGVDRAELNRPGLRSLLALAAYRIVNAAPNQAGSAL